MITTLFPKTFVFGASPIKMKGDYTYYLQYLFYEIN